MDFISAVKTCFGKFATFQGRARRSEYWYFILLLILGNIVFSLLDAATGIGVLSPIFALIMLFPTVAVSARRLHDNNVSGWWVLTFLVPILGTVVMLFWCCSVGTPGDNRFGPDPLAEPVTA